MRGAPLLLVGLVCLHGSAQSAELEAKAGASLRLGDVVGTAYDTVGPDGYRLVATLASASSATPVRVSPALRPGQTVRFAVPRGIGQPEITVAFSRTADRLFVTEAGALARLSD